MKFYSLIAIFLALFAFNISAKTIRYVDGAVLHMIDNKASYTDPKGATTICSIVIKTREITCSGEDQGMNFAHVNGRLQAGVRKMFRDAAP